jgi:hypothetical protein
VTDVWSAVRSVRIVAWLAAVAIPPLTVNEPMLDAAKTGVVVAFVTDAPTR